MRQTAWSPRVARSERALWKLYLEDPYYGSLGYAGFGDWELLEGRYTLAVLFEYAATLGLIDVAYDEPGGARDDYRGNWGADYIDALSRYDGLRAVRLNDLGAYVLAVRKSYTPPEPEAPGRMVKILPNLDVVDVGRLAPAELPGTLLTLLDEIAERAGRLTDLGQMRLIACADPALATLISHDRKLRPLCHLLGDRHLAVPVDREPDFRRALTALGYAVPNGVSRRPDNLP